MPRFSLILLMVSALFLTACPAPSVPTPETKITAFSADPATITAGEETTLQWTVKGEDLTLTIDNGVGTVTGSSLRVAPTETTAYTLSATGSDGSDTATVTVAVNPKTEAPKITAFEATPATIFAGEESTLSWTLTGSAATLSIDNDVGEVMGTSTTIFPIETTTYTLTASNSAGSDSATFSVTVTPPPFVETTFVSGKEGWAVSSATLATFSEGGSGGGDDNGYVGVTLPTNGVTSYYVAPRKFRTNWLTYDKLSFDLFSSGGEYFTGESPNRGDVFLANGAFTAQRLFANRPGTEWESFVIPLSDDGGWLLGGGATSLEEVLRRVTSFQIRAEYGMGTDSSGLDNVRLDSND